MRRPATSGSASSAPVDERSRERLAEHIRRGELWGIEEAGSLLTSCLLTTADHWFGGRRGRLPARGRRRCAARAPWADGGMYWMARGLDLCEAIRQRGFPAGLSGAVTLVVDDPLLPSAAGSWRVEFADGRASCAAAATADVRLDARAVGPLFTGFRDPAQLALGGLLDFF